MALPEGQPARPGNRLGRGGTLYIPKVPPQAAASLVAGGTSRADSGAGPSLPSREERNEHWYNQAW